MKYTSILLVILLSACSNKTITTKLSENTKRQIDVLKQEVQISKCEAATKTSFINKLELIKNDVDNIAVACNVEKDLLHEKITKLKVIILSFTIMLIGILYLNFKRR